MERREGFINLIMHEGNHNEVVVCDRCQFNTNIVRLVGAIKIQDRGWFLLQFYCPECHNLWICWDREYPIGGDIMYKIPHTWTLDSAAE